MKTIGLIGGMSWESTATYYQYINEQIRDQSSALTSAKILLNSLNFAEVVALQQSGNWHEAGELLAKAGKQLALAGADCLLICTNTMHLVADQVANAVTIPLLDIIAETAQALNRAGCRKPLLLATRYTMEHGFYTEQMARLGIDVVVPCSEGRGTLQRIIFEELCCGITHESSKESLLELIRQAQTFGIDAVILGCTELQLLLDAKQLPLPGFDSTLIHAQAAVRFAKQ